MQKRDELISDVLLWTPTHGRANVIYSHNKYAYIHIYMFMQHHNDTIIRQTHNDKVARTNDARKEDAGRLLFKYIFTSHFICKVCV